MCTSVSSTLRLASISSTTNPMCRYMFCTTMIGLMRAGQSCVTLTASYAFCRTWYMTHCWWWARMWQGIGFMRGGQSCVNLTAPYTCYRTWYKTYEASRGLNAARLAKQVWHNPIVGSQQGVRGYRWIRGKLDSWAPHCVVRLSMICWWMLLLARPTYPFLFWRTYICHPRTFARVWQWTTLGSQTMILRRPLWSATFWTHLQKRLWGLRTQSRVRATRNLAEFNASLISCLGVAVNRECMRPSSCSCLMRAARSCKEGITCVSISAPWNHGESHWFQLEDRPNRDILSLGQYHTVWMGEETCPTRAVEPHWAPHYQLHIRKSWKYFFILFFTFFHFFVKK